MKEFKNLSKEARIAIKRGVKAFLQYEMQDQFEECVIHSDDPERCHSYGIPDFLVEEFNASLLEYSNVFSNGVANLEGLFRLLHRANRIQWSLLEEFHCVNIRIMSKYSNGMCNGIDES